MNPIICIGNYHIDKKIKEMMKICDVIEIKVPTKVEIKNLLGLLMPNLEMDLMNNLVEFIGGDLRKLKSAHDIYKKQESILKNKLINNMFHPKHAMKILKK